MAWKPLKFRQGLLILASVAVLLVTRRAEIPTYGQSACGPTVNAIVCENLNPAIRRPSGTSAAPATPRSRASRPTSASCRARRQRFKVDTTASSFTLDIYRLGYYGGTGARKIATVTPTTATNQPELPDQCEHRSRRLRQLGGLGVVARAGDRGVRHLHREAHERHRRREPHPLHRPRGPAAAHHSDMVFQTSDTTWQAYNQLRRQQPVRRRSGHQSGPRLQGELQPADYDARHRRREDCRLQRRVPDGAVAGSERLRRQLHHRRRHGPRRGSAAPATTRSSCRSATTSTGRARSARTSRRRATPACTSRSSAATRCSGRRAGRTASTAPDTPYRTLVCYKETHANAKIDPAGSADVDRHLARPALQPAGRRRAAGERADRQMFGVNDGDTTAITVPAAHRQACASGATRRVATLAAGATATLPTGTLGYEWDGDVDNGFRPPRLMRLSHSTRNSRRSKLLDYGSTFGSGTVTHTLTLYRAPAARWCSAPARCSGRGGSTRITIAASTAADVRMQQATVNLFADMGVQPATLQIGLVAAHRVDRCAGTRPRRSRRRRTAHRSPPVAGHDHRHGGRHRRRHRLGRRSVDRRRRDVEGGDRHHELDVHLDGRRLRHGHDSKPRVRR